MYAIIFSSLLYLGSFVYPTYLYPCLFIFMIPLVIPIEKLTFLDGYAWGIIFFAGHLSWIAYSLGLRGQGMMSYVIYILSICYFSLFSGFWFWYKNLLDVVCMKKIKSLKAICAISFCTWVISTVTFICLTRDCSLALCDCLEGYPLMCPLLPLLSWSWYIAPIRYVGGFFYVFIIVLINMIIASLYIKYEPISLIFLCGLFLFPVCFWVAPPRSSHADPSTIAFVQPDWQAETLTAAELFYRIGRCLDTIAVQQPSVNLVLFPESSFPYNLMDWRDKLPAWTTLLDEHTSIIIGAHRYQGSCIYNSVYQIVDGKIVAWYDKTHLMPFVERMPLVIEYLPWLQSLYCNQGRYFSYPCDDQADVAMMGYRPCICSELFLQKKKQVRTGQSLIFVCNDSWLGYDFAVELGLRCAQLYALEHSASILYVGSYFGKILPG